MSNRVSNSMGNRVSNSNWVSNSMGNWVSNNSSLNNSWSILRNSLIGHILNNSISVVSIIDSLDSSIRKSNSVAARGCVSISGLRLLAQQDQGQHSQGQQQGGQQGLLQQQLPGQIQGEPAWLCCVCLKCFRDQLILGQHSQGQQQGG